MSNMQPSRFLFRSSLIFIKFSEHANSKGKRTSNILFAGWRQFTKKVKRNTMMVHEWEQKRVSQMSYDAKGNVSRVKPILRVNSSRNASFGYRIYTWSSSTESKYILDRDSDFISSFFVNSMKMTLKRS